MADDTMVNAGTPERPIFIPEMALDQGEMGRRWWELFSIGSVVLTDEQLEKASEATSGRKDS